MKLTVVRYRTKPEMAEENARLIQVVFQELRAKSLDDVRYLSLRRRSKLSAAWNGGLLGRLRARWSTHSIHLIRSVA